MINLTKLDELIKKEEKEHTESELIAELRRDISNLSGQDLIQHTKKVNELMDKLNHIR